MADDTTEVPKSPRRRTLIEYTAGTMVVGGIAAAGWPMLMQMTPSRTIKPPTRIELTSLKPGQSRIINVKGSPSLLRHRTPEEIAESRRVDTTKLTDPLARNENLPDGALANDDNRSFGSRGQFIFMSMLCTHLGCVLTDYREETVGTSPWPSQFYCQCHSARFDVAGRVIYGPAPTNLPIPRFKLVDDAELVLGSEVGTV